MNTHNIDSGTVWQVFATRRDGTQMRSRPMYSEHAALVEAHSFEAFANGFGVSNVIIERFDPYRSAAIGITIYRDGKRLPSILG